MKCPTCGAELPPGENSCTACGQEVIPAGTVSVADPAAHPPQPRMSPAAVAPRTYPVSRITGIVILLFGMLLLLANLRFGVPTGKGLGILGMVVGAAFVGLSFVPGPRPAAAGAPAQPLSTVDTLTRVFYEPEPVFKNLKHHPRWLAALLVLGLLGAAYQFAVVQRLGPERRADDMATRVIDGGFLQGAPISPDDFRQMQIAQAVKTAGVDQIFQPLGAVAGTALFMLVVASLYLLAVLAFGGRMNFWQAVSVTVYSALPPAVILTALNLILLYTQSVDDIVPLKAAQQNLARADLGLLFAPADHPGLYTLASFIGLFSIYRLWLAATGLRNVADKIKSGSAWAIVLILWFFGALLAALLSVFFPTFVA